jgi:hypothetical protein
MVTIGSLWLPILLSAVAVWIVSAIFWTVSPHHKSDFKGMPGEDDVLDTMRKHTMAPGQYFFPFYGKQQDADKPEVAQKLQKGPVGVLTVWPAGKPAMGKPMVLSLVFYAVVSLFVAYLTSRTLGAGTEYLQVFRVATTIAFLSYSAGIMPGAIWFGAPWRTTWKSAADGLVYGALTGGIFGWLWPVAGV